MYTLNAANHSVAFLCHAGNGAMGKRFKTLVGVLVAAAAVAAAIAFFIYDYAKHYVRP